MKILVIDDKSSDGEYPRKKLLDVLKTRAGIDYDIIEPDPETLINKLGNGGAGKYKLIIVDYMLDRSSSIFKTGTALYSLIRAFAQSIPIYLISVKTAPTNQIGDFDLFINDDAIKNYSQFKSEIESHIKLMTCYSTADFLRALKCPNNITEEIEIMIKPTMSKKEQENGNSGDQIPDIEITDSLNLRLFRWMARSLLRKEGPLVSQAGAASLLGISTEYFNSISNKFDSALYNGIFSSSFPTRWWSSLLEDKIYEIEDPNNYLETLSFKEAASLLLDAKELRDFSVCVRCETKYPDGLGIVYGQENELLPVHVYCSSFDETITQEPFFRNPRIIEVD